MIYYTIPLASRYHPLAILENMGESNRFQRGCFLSAVRDFIKFLAPEFAVCKECGLFLFRDKSVF